MSTRLKILGAAFAVFTLGSGFIVYNGRPVKLLERAEADTIVPEVVSQQQEPGDHPEEDRDAEGNVVVQEQPASEVPSPAKDKVYTMSDVQAHSAPGNCWAAINGAVYDLTTWVSRHPGGAERITALCGKDSTAMFERKHGKTPSAQAALVLLKIGTLNLN